MVAQAAQLEVKETRRALLVGAGLWGLLFGPFLTTGSLPVFRDLLLTYLPMRLFWAERVRAGHLPQWFPWEGLGVSFIGQGVTGTFHPVNLLYLAFGPALALRLEISLTVLFGVVGLILLARAFKLSAPAAVTGAMVLVLNGYALSMTNNPLYLRGLGSLPWVALFASRVLTSSRPAAWTAALAVAWALIPLGGDAAATVMAGIVVAGMVAMHGLSRRVGWLALAAVCTVALAAPELLPAMELRRISVLDNVLDRNLLSTMWALEPGRLPELLLTGLRGRPTQWAESVVLGAPALALALGAPRRRPVIVLALMFTLGLWLALGSHGGLDPVLRRLIPVFNGIRYPEKQLALVAFATAALVAFGVDGSARALRAVALAGAVTLAAAFAAGDLKYAASSLGALAGLAGLQWLRSRYAWVVWLLPMLILAVLYREPRGLLTLPEAAFLAPTSQALPLGPAHIWAEEMAARPVTDTQSLATWATAVHDLRSGSVGALHHQVVIGPTPNFPIWPRIERQVLGLDLHATRALAPVYGFDTVLPANDDPPIRLEAPLRARLVSPRGAASALDATAAIHADPAGAIAHPFLIGEVPNPVEGRLGEVRWVLDDIDALVLEADVDRTSVLTLHDGIGLGWSAEVDGLAVPLVAVNVLSRGVLLPPGRHEVVFRYEVPGLLTGLTLCGLASVLLLVLLVRERRELAPFGGTSPQAPSERAV